MNEDKVVTPREWRIEEGYTHGQMAVLVGLRGRNCRQTFMKYETGEVSVPLDIIEKFEKVTEGMVTWRGWLVARRAYLDKVGKTPDRERAAA